MNFPHEYLHMGLDFNFLHWCVCKENLLSESFGEEIFSSVHKAQNNWNYGKVFLGILENKTKKRWQID